MPRPLVELVDAFAALSWQQRVWSLAVFAMALLAGLIAVALLFRTLTRWAHSSESLIDKKALVHLRRPARWLLPTLALRLFLPLVPLPSWLIEPIAHLLALAIVASVAWFLFGCVRVLEQSVISRFDVSKKDNLNERAIHSQMRGFRNIASFMIVGGALASALLTFESVRGFGVTLFASAGIASIIIGFAAKKSIATLIAGVQVAITQPIRLDDVVIVEGEWGWIEEVTLTYVVVRIWDLRRLVVPITYFLEQPFQNWTRTSSDLLGTVFLYADYRIPTDELRAELKRILDASELWDGKTWSLQVTNMKEQTVELRALMSAADSSRAWDLRCEVREKLLRFVQEQHPESLPRVRAELEQSGSK